MLLSSSLSMMASSTVALAGVWVSTSTTTTKPKSKATSMPSLMSSSSSSSSATATKEVEASSYPDQRRRDELFVLIGQDAGKYWHLLPSEWQQSDKQFILKALRESPTLPPKAEFERQFSLALRCHDKDVVLAFCQRSDFVSLYYERHLFVPENFCNDLDVMMEYCRKIPRQLQECSEELCNHRDLVQCAVQNVGGLELQYASRTLLEDNVDLVRLACQSDGRALEYCPPNSPARLELIQDYDFMLNIVLNSPGSGTMWKLLPPFLKQDEELLLRALKHGLAIQSCPSEFLEKPEFLQRAIQGRADFYLQLPTKLQSLESLAFQAIISPDSTSEIHQRALEYCPTLRNNRQVVLAICQRGQIELIQQVLKNNDDTSITFCDDFEIMKLAVSKDCTLFEMASVRLRQLPELIVCSITPTSAWHTLQTTSWSLQRQHPIIVSTAIQQCTLHRLRYLPSHIPDDVWTSNPSVVLAWIKRGGRVLDTFTTMIQQDKVLALHLAKHNSNEFYKVGDVLLNDKKFMLQALQQNGQVLQFASQRLRQDLDVGIVAVAHYYPKQPKATPTNTTTNNNKLQPISIPGLDLKLLSCHIQKALALHSTFVRDFLRGISFGPNSSSINCLDLDPDTSMEIKRHIAEYLGVPMGPQLTLLRTAQANLKRQRKLSKTTTRKTNSNSNNTRRRHDYPQRHHHDLDPMMMMMMRDDDFGPADQRLFHRLRIRRFQEEDGMFRRRAELAVPEAAAERQQQQQR